MWTQNSILDFLLGGEDEGGKTHTYPLKPVQHESKFGKSGVNKTKLDLAHELRWHTRKAQGRIKNPLGV